MKAVILAGGLGTRLGEETAVRPKPMVEIGGMPIIWHIMKIYSAHGVNDFVICLGYKGYLIKEFFANYFLHTADVTIDIRENTREVHEKRSEPWRITLVETGADTMTGGRLKAVADYLPPDEPFCFTYGDGVAAVDVSAQLAFHKAHGRKATVTAVAPPGRFGALEFEGDRVLRFREKPAGDGGLINGGFFIADLIIPCSSGSAFTPTMQLYQQQFGQRMITNKSLASMGYGLSGAIGAALGGGGRRTILIEGDGGFAQNMQEVGTAAINDLNLKIFIFDDQGHASIRMTQRSYFDGKYLGCDVRSGLGLPHWNRLFAAWDVPVMALPLNFTENADVRNWLELGGVQAFIVPVDPEQTYFPKITSRVTETGSMVSNPIDRMSPDVDYLSGLLAEA